MQRIFHRNDHQAGIVIVTGGCCIPGMAAFDAQARRVVEQAVSETGVEAQVKMMPVTTAMMGGVPKEAMGQATSLFQAGQMPLPAILINGEGVSYGMPNVEDIKAALLRSIDAKTTRQEEGTNK
ncbi:MAG: hypothetical protein C0393_08290 [Anaerolinea sp.]|nr:hypothetical protein [Anaerolinea sp.]